MKFIESETLELKKSTSELKEDIISIVSILNKHEQGGLYFGIKNEALVVGQDINEKTILDISKSISDNSEPRIYPKIVTKTIQGKTCIVVNFEGSEIPYFAYGRAYIRVGDERNILRNPLIAHTLYLSRNIERWGSGLRRIYISCKEEQVKVEFVKLKSGFLVVFHRKETEYKGVSGDAATPQVTPQATPQVHLTELESKIINEIIANKRISRTQLAKYLDVSPETIKEYIKKLKNKGVLVRHGKTSGGYWEIIKESY